MPIIFNINMTNAICISLIDKKYNMKHSVGIVNAISITNMTNFFGKACTYLSVTPRLKPGLATLNFSSPNEYQRIFSYHIGYMINVDCSTSGTLTRPDSPKIYSGTASFLILGFSLPDTQRVPSI
jgi:hypothetical protein